MPAMMYNALVTLFAGLLSAFLLWQGHTIYSTAIDVASIKEDLKYINAQLHLNTGFYDGGSKPVAGISTSNSRD